MIKVLPYIETLGSEKFKEFLLAPFKLNLLVEKIEKNTIINYEVVFDGWYGKSIGDWFKLRNDDGVVLEFYSTHYDIKIKVVSYRFSLPDTINDFINDMCRLNIDLYWSTWIDEKFEPKEYLNEEGVENYFRGLLGKMDKSHEISENL